VSGVFGVARNQWEDQPHVYESGRVTWAAWGMGRYKEMEIFLDQDLYYLYRKSKKKMYTYVTIDLG
jgi:hypothetical protein